MIKISQESPKSKRPKHKLLRKRNKYTIRSYKKLAVEKLPPLPTKEFSVVSSHQLLKIKTNHCRPKSPKSNSSSNFKKPRLSKKLSKRRTLPLRKKVPNRKPMRRAIILTSNTIKARKPRRSTRRKKRPQSQRKLQALLKIY